LSERSSAIASVAALDDPQRRRLYGAVRRARRPLTREEAAQAVGISRKLAAFHLDKLVDLGLLEVVVVPVLERRGVGRTPKRYQPAREVVDVTIPDRSFRVLAEVLVDAAVNADDGEDPEEARARVARQHGRDRGTAAAQLRSPDETGESGGLALAEQVLADEGFEPYRTSSEALRLYNCPFHPLAAQAPGLVCGINLHYLTGLLEGLHLDSVSAVLAPRAGECCVEICTAR
jgi:predicted ArsR family transcriptional regulator